MPRIGSSGVNLPYPSVNSNLITNSRTLAPGAVHLIPAGIFQLFLGPYTVFQTLDPISGIWETTTLASDYIESDGVNMRLANLTGCSMGAFVTTAGTGYLTVPTVTASAGNSKYTAILGGSLTTPTTTIPTAGVGYNHPPQVLIPPPPVGGVQASMVIGLSAGGLSGATLINAGAGYNSTVTPIIVPHPLDTVTTPAVVAGLPVNTALATNVTAILCTDPGTAQTLVPTLTITAAPLGGTTAVAVPVMMFTVTGINITSGGLNYGGTAPFQIYSPGTFVPGVRSVTAPNPITDTGLYQPQPFSGYGVTGAGTAGLTTLNFVVSYGGMHQTIPQIVAPVGAGTQVATQLGVITANVGGVSDTSFLNSVV